MIILSTILMTYACMGLLFCRKAHKNVQRLSILPRIIAYILILIFWFPALLRERNKDE
jgi:uncharacterized membrane protein YeiB